MKAIRPIIHYFSLIIFALFFPSALSARKPTFRPNMHGLNVMTVTKTNKKADLTECELVKKIYRRRMPKEATISIDGTPYCYHMGIHPAVKKAKHVYLMSRGYATRKKITGPDKDDHFVRNGGCVIHTRDRVAQNVVHVSDESVAVTFDYKDGYANFGQKRDIACLRYVYNAIRSHNPDAHIIIVSECLGAKVALELATHDQMQNTTLVLESPFFQATDIFELMAHNYIKMDWMSSVLYWGSQIFKHYDPRQDDLPTRLHAIPTNMKIFACHRNKDPLLKDECFERHMHTLCTQAHDAHVTCFRFDDIEERHSSTFRWQPSQQAVNAFYKSHGLPFRDTAST